MSDGQIEPIRDWQHKQMLITIRDRDNLLQTLKYQSAFAVFAGIVGIWTIFSQDNISSQLKVSSGCLVYLLTLATVTGWRAFTHIINRELSSLYITRLACEFHLKILPPKYQINTINTESGTISVFPFTVEKLNLNKVEEFKKLTVFQQIAVMKKLHKHLLDDGIEYFDLISILGITALFFVVWPIFPIDESEFIWMYMVWWICIFIFIYFFKEMHPSDDIIREKIQEIQSASEPIVV
jgi:hypothetical protein